MTAERMLTPTSAALDLFLELGHRRVMVLGGKGITEPLEAAGIETLPPLRGTQCDAVMAGWYRQELTFDALEAACFAVFDGAAMYSASQSLFFATAEGKSLGTSRAISAVVRDITGCEVTVVGKPSVRALHTAARRLGLAPADLAVVGDDPELEVPMAHAGGATRRGGAHRDRPRGVVLGPAGGAATAPGPAGRGGARRAAQVRARLIPRRGNQAFRIADP